MKRRPTKQKPAEAFEIVRTVGLELYVAFMGGRGQAANVVGPNDAEIDDPPLLFVFKLDGTAELPAAAPLPENNRNRAPDEDQ